MSADKAVTTLLYRCILRWNKQLASVPLDVRASHVDEVLPGFRQQHNGGFGSIRELAQWGFRQDATGTDALTGDILTKDEHKALLLDRGFQALQILNSEYAQALTYLQSTRQKHLDARGVQFTVGTVIRHKKYGYKGVIYAWDRVCDRPPQWAQEMQVNHDQPFYGVLPDEHDCTRLFQGARISKYVAQENIEVVQNERVVHRAISNYFPEYSSDLGRYIPNTKMQYEYPGTYQASDAQSCLTDSNLLLHEEPELYNDPYADPYEDDPDYVQGRCPGKEAEAKSQQAARLASGSSSPEEGGKAAGNEAMKAKSNKESKKGPGNQEGMPEQSVGTDVKR
ncbi:hypothetical protein ABBQ38_007787 [Trebouxia sp. C0009 RCD-2024]